MHRHPKSTRTLASLLAAMACLPPLARGEQLPLAQYPAGTASRQPAPNVILTLDDSGSMGYYAGGGLEQNETYTTSRMYALKTALRSVFSAQTQNIPDGAIRLAWNTLNNCFNIPSASGGCNNLNGMRVLDATHRANFLNWIGQPGAATDTSRRLSAWGSTPTHRAYIAAGDYLKNGSTTSAESPWASVPGTTAQPMLSCRRSYNVLMTDGGWNFTFANHGDDVSRPRNNPNADGTSITLPDGTTRYDVTSPVTRLYRDGWGQPVRDSDQTANVSTLADLAFYYWSTDLATGLANDLRPKIEQSGAQTFGTGSSAVTLPEFWNPRNNPATWQHMTTYTIGFGDAAQWRTAGSYNSYPRWDLVGNDSFGGSLADLITGAVTWPDPIKNTLKVVDSSNNGDEAQTNGEARKVELWHMALNGRGKFIASTTPQALLNAFQEIFSAIVADNRTPVTAFTNSASSIGRGPATQYTSAYEANGWKGYLRADVLAAMTGAATPDPGWGMVGTQQATTADKLDALSNSAIANRLVLTFSDATGNSGGASFQWTAETNPTVRALSAAQKTLLRAEAAGSVVEAVGQQRVAYLRGDTAYEGRSFEGTAFRDRISRQGDIVNSNPWYVAAPVSNYGFDGYLDFVVRHARRLPMVYVGGNDGMLHGFSGEDGSEKIAYVPKGVIQHLPALTRPNYQHRYYVDGSPFTGDVNWGSAGEPDWRTLLVGTLGAGGKGYFVLDVTTPGSRADTPASQAVASNFSKANAASLVVVDKTSVAGASTEDADIGHIMVNPVLEDNNPQKTTQITRMNNGRWALVMGNGYNSTNERPVLLIQYLDGDRELARITAASSGTNASTNGLSAPSLVDIDGNGTPDVVYAGDLRGNLWKFDLADSNPANWRVAFDGSPLYTAVHVAGNVRTVQPITVPPVVRSNDRGAGGLMVAFGTGRNLTESDRTGQAVQSLYSVLDNTRYKLSSAGKVQIDTAVTPAPVGTGVANLVRQTVGATAVDGSGVSTGLKFWTLSQNAVPYTGDGAKKGWYLDLPDTGERVLSPMSFYDSSNVLEVLSVVPASGGSLAEESCAPPSSLARNYRTLINIMDGRPPSVQVMDTNGDGIYLSSTDSGTSRMTAWDAENRISTPTKQLRTSATTAGTGSGGTGGSATSAALANLPEIPLRPNWRQLQ